MEENFNPVARTRANYYTPGSPVQFVCVELLKGELSGENAVCLTFKNISKVTLTALEIHFKCKGVDGIILCEDEFEYRDIAVKPGESFGMDDAVFVTQKAITSVDVVLKNVYSGKKVVHLDAIKRVPGVEVCAACHGLAIDKMTALYGKRDDCSTCHPYHARPMHGKVYENRQATTKTVLE